MESMPSRAFASSCSQECVSLKVTLVGSWQGIVMHHEGNRSRVWPGPSWKFVLLSVAVVPPCPSSLELPGEGVPADTVIELCES